MEQVFLLISRVISHSPDIFKLISDNLYTLIAIVIQAVVFYRMGIHDNNKFSFEKALILSVSFGILVVIANYFGIDAMFEAIVVSSIMVVSAIILGFVMNQIELYKNTRKPKIDENILIEILRAYGRHLETYSLPFEEIRHESLLPFSKKEILYAAINQIKNRNEAEQNLLLAAIPQLSFYRDDIPISGCCSKIKKTADYIKTLPKINGHEYMNLEQLKAVANLAFPVIDFEDDECFQKLYSECQTIKNNIRNILIEQIG